MKTHLLQYNITCHTTRNVSKLMIYIKRVNQQTTFVLTTRYCWKRLPRSRLSWWIGTYNNPSQRGFSSTISNIINKLYETDQQLVSTKDIRANVGRPNFITKKWCQNTILRSRASFFNRLLPKWSLYHNTADKPCCTKHVSFCQQTNWYVCSSIKNPDTFTITMIFVR